jgi:hypothetical protein
MSRFLSRRVVVGLGLSGLLVVACARANLDDTGEDPGTEDSGVTEPSGGSVDASPKPPIKDSGTTTPPPVSDAGSDAAPIQDASTDGPVTPPPTPSCDFSNACPATVTTLGTVSGNLTTTTVSASGTSSQWVNVIVKDEGFLFGNVKLSAKLTGPSAGNYGLLAYEAAPASTACTSATQQNLNTDNVKTMSFSWSQNIGDDGRSVTFEVRHLAGACTADQSWKLELTGTPP